jgi:hypothetical protein
MTDVTHEELAASSGSSLVGFIRGDTGAVATDLQAYLRSLAPFRPEDFGAVGNGHLPLAQRTDDYDAFKAMVAAVNAAEGGCVLLGRNKTYWIGRYYGQSGVTDIPFSDCDGLLIEGNGATISVKGDFTRTSSSVHSLAGLRFEDCRNVVVRNVELNGNVGDYPGWPTQDVAISSGSAVATVASTTGILVGQYLRASASSGIQDATTVASVDSATQLTLSKTATQTTTVEDVVFAFGDVGASTGLDIRSVNNGLFENLYSHHFQTDGLIIRETAQPDPEDRRLTCRNLSFRNCQFKFNARQGTTITQTRGCTFDNCDFSYSGWIDEAATRGPYGGHSPEAGIDVEPDISELSGGGGQLMDQRCGEITFNNCRAIGSRGAAFLASKYANGHHYLEQVYLNNCHFETGDGVTGGNDGFIFDVPDGVVDGCFINTRDKTCFVGYYSSSTASWKFINNTVRGRSQAASVYNVHAKPSAKGLKVIAFNNFVGEQAGAKASNTGAWLFYFQDANTYLVGNRFTLPKEAYVDSSTAGGTDILQAVYVNSGRAEGNRYETDLLASSGDSGTAHYGVMYGSAVVARNEHFAGVARGWADTVRPGRQSTSLAWSHDTNIPYASNVRMARVVGHNPASLALGAASSITATTVLGVSLGERVNVEFSLDGAGVAFAGCASATDTVKWWAVNQAGASPTDLGQGDVYLTVTKRSG